MTLEEFEELLQQREGETLDFKQEMPISSDWQTRREGEAQW